VVRIIIIMPARSRRIVVNVVAALVAAATWPVMASAQDRPLPADVGPVDGGGAFVMQSCGETGVSFGWATTLNANEDALATGIDCPPSSRPPGYPTSFQQAGLWASDRLGDAGGALEAHSGDRAEMTFVPLPGTTITRLRYWRAIHKIADPGDRWQPYISLSTRSNVIDTCIIGGQSTCYAGGDDWFPNDATTTNRSSYRDLPDISANSIIIGLFCADSDVHTCGNGSLLTHVDAEIFSAFLTISDPTPPTVGTPSGAGWTADTWSQGTLPLSLASSDTTGISATRVYADGSLIASLQRSCSYDRPRPCTDEPAGAVGLPTAALADGAHQIAVGGVDAAGNETRVQRAAALLVDNNAPAAPVGLVSPAPASTENRFEARWSLPPDTGSPIVAARYQLCQAAVCGAVQTAPSLTAVDGLALPAGGDASLRVWLVDGVGHEAPDAAATLALRYAPPTLDPNSPPTPDLKPTISEPQQQPKPRPRPAPKAAPALKITSLRHSGRRILLRGTISSRASGRVTVRFRTRVNRRTRTLTLHPAIRARAFRATFTLPGSIARARAGTATVTYAGDADTRPAARRATIRWHV
jgi:hypothetical protein